MFLFFIHFALIADAHFIVLTGPVRWRPPFAPRGSEG